MKTDLNLLHLTMKVNCWNESSWFVLWPLVSNCIRNIYIRHGKLLKQWDEIEFSGYRVTVDVKNIIYIIDLTITVSVWEQDQRTHLIQGKHSNINRVKQDHTSGNRTRLETPPISVIYPNYTSFVPGNDNSYDYLPIYQLIRPQLNRNSDSYVPDLRPWWLGCQPNWGKLLGGIRKFLNARVIPR